ncbi:uncharacterized protein LOC117646932 [Thrips palmi]|uniref:Uncharacterized protein LOC117646932 n=1 Tax=Thrips palmi TaxID=161013 RepID=A0A6P8Z2G9_THRPL|nr:uncharacterized protein LOC117646932 [Thrips palmi]
MEVVQYQYQVADVNAGAASPPLASPGSAGAHSPPYQHSQYQWHQYAAAQDYLAAPERAPLGVPRVRVVKPTAVRLRPAVDESRLPCCGYPGPIKIPLCGDLQCRHLPCYTWHTWHQQHAAPTYWWASLPPSSRSWQGTASPESPHLSLDLQPQGLLQEALRQKPAAEESAAAADVTPVTPVQATVTTPGGTVTLYSWPDSLQLDDDVVVVEQVQPKRARKAAAKPRKPRAPRKPRQTKKDKDAAEEVLGAGVAVNMDTDTRGALLRALGLLCDRRGDLDAKEDDEKDDDDLPFLQLQPNVPRKVRRVLRGVAKALM